ncbi:unnamed protein product, partial [Tenebrio molitor]
LASRCVTKAAIAGHDGNVWAKSEGFDVSFPHTSQPDVSPVPGKSRQGSRPRKSPEIGAPQNKRSGGLGRIFAAFRSDFRHTAARKSRCPRASRCGPEKRPSFCKNTQFVEISPSAGLNSRWPPFYATCRNCKWRPRYLSLPALLSADRNAQP